MMKSKQSSLLNQAEMYLQSKRLNDPSLLGQGEFQFCSLIRFHTLWNQNKKKKKQMR